ncbi:DEKNAAC103696 [Brettanomyces naardenensis]|uniref:DEKNAAC103696 n=1 Tax=Brettanomyces naardenensis TaxID=13370 RepID=A0A448YNR1_BRENA|nr:DEKNAAC103696 [Brettanomyces naardenensis]
MYKPKIFKELAAKTRGHPLARALSHDSFADDNSTIFTLATKNNNNNANTDAEHPPQRGFLNRIRSYTAPVQEPEDPETNEHERELREMNDIAFEVRMPDKKRNVHPLDQPIVLKSGKEISPITGEFHTSGIRMSMNDISGCFELLWDALYKLAMTIWNLDLFINIERADNSTLRLHIPTILLGLFGIHFVTSFLFTANSQTDPIPYYGQRKSQAENYSFKFSHLVNFLAVVGVCGYLLIKITKGEVDGEEQNSDGDDELEREEQSDALSIAASDGTTNSDTPSDERGSPYGRNRRRKSREDSTLKIPQTLHTQRHHSPVRRLTLNRPIDRSSGRKSMRASTDIERMKRAGREELLRAFSGEY